jgi:hypothetical protein
MAHVSTRERTAMRTRMTRLLYSALLGTGVATHPVVGGETGPNIIRAHREHQVLRDQQETLTMTLVERKSGTKETSERQLIRYTTAAADGSERTLLRFLAPGDVTDRALLTVERKDGNADQWEHEPRTHKTRRVPPSERTQYFAGTTLAYEDLQPENLTTNRYTITASETFHGFAHWAIAAQPLPQYAQETAYGKRLIWIRKDNFALVRRHYYSKSGQLVKIEKHMDIGPVSGTAARAREVRMRDIQGRKKTIVTVVSRVQDAALDQSLFTPEGLEKRTVEATAPAARPSSPGSP